MEDNHVHLYGVVCAVPTDKDFVLNVGEDYIHCTCHKGLPHLGEQIEIDGCLRSKLTVLYGKNVVLHEVEWN